MDSENAHSRLGRAWALSARQHGVVARRQLLELGLHPQGIAHRIARGRLHPTAWRGVYAVGRPQLTRRGLLMAAVLTGGPDAVLSHGSAAELWEIRPPCTTKVEISVPNGRRCRRAGLVEHRRPRLAADDMAIRHEIPVTAPILTLLDLATCLARDELETAIAAADALDLVDWGALRRAVDERPGERGTAIVRELLDRRTFAVTDSHLERMFLPIARQAGLPPPLTQQWVNGFRVDFYWPELGLVAETDGLRYHRTPQQQSVDRRRDQVHAAAGLTTLRFTHAQIRFEARHVRDTLASVARRLAAG